MDLGDNKNGFICGEKWAKWTTATITGNVSVIEKSSAKTKRSFKVFFLPIKVDGYDDAGLDNLLRSQLNKLVNKYGKYTETWAGKEIKFRAVPDKDFWNWEIE